MLEGFITSPYTQLRPAFWYRDMNSGLHLFSQCLFLTKPPYRRQVCAMYT
jgi:hypothetical protein